MKRNVKNILDFFHHIHYSKNNDEHIHHCGREHKKINSKLDYEINHCSCGKHSINKKVAIGHTVNQELELNEVIVEFHEKCPSNGWHIESGKVMVNKQDE